MSNLIAITGLTASAIVHSFSQVMFQKHLLTGVCIILAIGLHSLPLLLGSFIGAIVGNFTAYILKFNQTEIEKGFYGYCAVLVGIACIYFYSLTYIAIVLSILGSVLACLFTYFMLHRQRLVAPLTFAFVVSTWIMLLIGSLFKQATLVRAPTISTDYIVQHALTGIGQIFFVENFYSGALILLGIFLSTWYVGFWVIVAAIMSTYLGKYLGAPSDLLTQGIYSFNAILVVIYLSQIYKTNLVFIVFAIVLSILITHSYSVFQLPLPYLTMPFVLSCWLVYLVNQQLKKRRLSSVS